MFTARLEFADQAAIELQVEDGETLAEAAMRQNAPLRSDCLSGECGACLARCNETDSLDGERPAIISPEEASEGLVAACRTRLRADATLHLEYPLTPRPSEPAKLRATLESLETVCTSVSRLVLRLEEGCDFAFQPGQYIRLRPPGLRVPRAYSIASTPSDMPFVTLLIRHVEGGEVTRWLTERATVGDRLVLQAPLGGFAAETRARRQVFIAGGTGLAPILAMIAAQDESSGPKLLCFGCSAREHLFMVDELRALERATPGLEVRIALLTGAEGTIRKGHAVALLEPEDLEPDAAFHLCGPPGMIDAARQTLRAAGIAPEKIRAERFLASA